MLSERAASYVHELRAWQRDGILRRLWLEQRHDGTGLPLDLAVTIVLNDLDDLNDRATHGAAIPDGYWRQLSADIERLHRLVADSQPG